MTASAAERVRVIAPGQTYVGKQGFTYGAGASADTVGSRYVCMNVLPVPAGARAKAHYHRDIETVAYLLDGACAVYYGDRLEQRVVLQAGEQIYLPADVPHAPCNESGALASGSSFTLPAAISTASFSCPISTSFLPPKCRAPEAARGASRHGTREIFCNVSY
jgi:uncharacterized RmlC-like cupin family protein